MRVCVFAARARAPPRRGVAAGRRRPIALRVVCGRAHCTAQVLNEMSTTARGVRLTRAVRRRRVQRVREHIAAKKIALAIIDEDLEDWRLLVGQGDGDAVKRRMICGSRMRCVLSEDVAGGLVGGHVVPPYAVCGSSSVCCRRVALVVGIGRVRQADGWWRHA